MQNVVRNENIFYCVLFFIFFYLPTKNLKLLQLLYLSIVTCFSMFQSLSLDVQPTSLSFFHLYLFPLFLCVYFFLSLVFLSFSQQLRTKKIIWPKEQLPHWEIWWQEHNFVEMFLCIQKLKSCEGEGYHEKRRIWEVFQ